jgi:hypothetical protein
MLSRGRVGLAPITPQSYFEEFLAAKLPLQVFAQAITFLFSPLGTPLTQIVTSGRHKKL